MSYSFNAKAGSKTELLEAVKSKLAEVVASQPVHSRDEAQAAVTTEAVLGLIADPAEGEEVNAYVSGSLGWRGDVSNPEAITSASVNISVSITNKPTDDKA